MAGTSRRQFLKLAGSGAGAAMFPSLIDRALAIAANRSTGSIRDVDHIIVYMQENRSFDHYFGLFPGVRGFGDPRPLLQPDGSSVWAQKGPGHADGHVLPFHGDSRTTRAFTVDGSAQGHQANLTIFNRGRFDRWGETGELAKRMLHYGPADLPFYYALADAFTLCDAYHCSTLTQTYPNRLHLFTGCNGGGTVLGDPEMTNYGEDETPSADMATDRPLRADAYRWTTYAERLQAAGIDWKVYQEYDNFGDNLLSVFPPFRPAPRDSELYRRGRAWIGEQASGPDRTRSDGAQLVAAFRSDVEAGRLPQISWIITAKDLSEHPDAEPARGEHIAARLIEALVDHPDVFARTVFIINYDESGGFFDHVPPPVPPLTAEAGASTIPVAGEAKDYGARAVANRGLQPLGLGIRVPAIIVSPWSSGGRVCSELFDHTSVLRLMEQRFGVGEPNISPWRRAVCGDLTSCFDFAAPSRARAALPNTDDFAERVARSKMGVASSIPQQQGPTAQMPGQRAARPLGYRFDVVPAVRAGKLWLDMHNEGSLGVALAAHDRSGAMAPRHYTLGAGGRLVVPWADAGPYDVAIWGPNGFLRRFAGATDGTVEAVLAADADTAVVTLLNRGPAARCFTVILDPAYRTTAARERPLSVAAGAAAAMRWELAPSDGWFDLLVRVDGEPDFQRRFAGHIDPRRQQRTDPAIGAMRLDG
jgi:phospholipase C